MDKSTYPRVGQVDLSIGRVVFKNTGVFREENLLLRSRSQWCRNNQEQVGEQRSGMEEGAIDRRAGAVGWVMGGGFGVLLRTCGGGAFGTSAREVKDELFFLPSGKVRDLWKVARRMSGRIGWGMRRFEHMYF